ncbi:MAG: crossover junction endodeoxyribonuclease RuvC [Candidatus Paracaedibacteraceae bacterium]|nr:crossover junction endodeoxyribonuclease RuvC [Candidatus Paracaedibacteraceae bacterium]
MLQQANTVRILGLDPGLRHTGWGLIESSGQRIRYLGSGVINPNVKQESLALRLAELFEKLLEIVKTCQPDEAVVEEVFVNKNPGSTLKLGMARGVVLLVPAHCDVSVFEYTANQVKKSVVGAGHADKTQVIHMVRRLLPATPVEIKPDAADALAVALCHAHQRMLNQYSALLQSAG